MQFCELNCSSDGRILLQASHSGYFSSTVFFLVFRLGEERFSIKINKKNTSRWLLKQEKTAEESIVLGLREKYKARMKFCADPNENFVVLFEMRTVKIERKEKKSSNNEHKHNK